MAEKKVVAKKEENLPSVIDFSQDIGAGYEEADKEAYAIPFLTILQSGSPQCKRSEGAYIKGAEEGMLFNTVTEEVFDGDKGIYVVPCFYQRQFLEWIPRNKGGGLAAVHSVSEAMELEKTLKTITVVEDGQEKEVRVLENGNTLTDTRQHYCLMYNEESGETFPVVLGMSSSQLKVSRKWMTKMQNIKINGHEAPMFSQVYHITTIPEKNDKGSWMGYHVDHFRQVQNIEVYKTAKAFYELCRAGDVEMDAGSPVTEGGDPEVM